MTSPDLGALGPYRGPFQFGKPDLIELMLRALSRIDDHKRRFMREHGRAPRMVVRPLAPAAYVVHVEDIDVSKFAPARKARKG